MMITQYALITSGSVTNIILGLPSPTWTPPAGETVVAIPSGITVGIGYTYAGGTFTAPAVTPPTLTPAQQASAALAAGLTIASTSTPALDGTYDVSDAAQSRITRVQTYIAANGKFPGANTTLNWPLLNGSQVVFPSIAEFQAFATEVANYVWALDEIAGSNAGTLPAATVTIA